MNEKGIDILETKRKVIKVIIRDIRYRKTNGLPSVEHIEALRRMWGSYKSTQTAIKYLKNMEKPIFHSFNALDKMN